MLCQSKVHDCMVSDAGLQHVDQCNACQKTVKKLLSIRTLKPCVRCSQCSYHWHHQRCKQCVLPGWSLHHPSKLSVKQQSYHVQQRLAMHSAAQSFACICMHLYASVCMCAMYVCNACVQCMCAMYVFVCVCVVQSPLPKCSYQESSSFSQADLQHLYCYTHIARVSVANCKPSCKHCAPYASLS